MKENQIQWNLIKKKKDCLLIAELTDCTCHSMTFKNQMAIMDE